MAQRVTIISRWEEVSMCAEVAKSKRGVESRKSRTELGLSVF